MLYRTRNPKITAVRYDGSAASVTKAQALFPSMTFSGPVGVGDMLLIEGGYQARPGEWIARNSRGQINVFSDDVFETEYELISS